MRAVVCGYCRSFVVMLLGLCCAVRVSADSPPVLYWGELSPKTIVEAPVVDSCFGEDARTPWTVSLNQLLHVRVYRLEQFMKDVKEPANIILVLDNVRMEGIHAMNADVHSGIVTFMLDLDEYNAANYRSWTTLLGGPRSFSRPVSVSIAARGGGSPLATVITKRDRLQDDGVVVRAERGAGWALSLTVVRPLNFGIATVVILVGLGVLIRLARRSMMLRAERIGQQRTADVPYSLSTTQLFVWFVAIASSSIYLYLVTGVLLPFNASVLGILGVSAATGFVAGGIKNQKQDAGVPAQTAQPTVPAVPTKPAQSFWKDILSDNAADISLQRVQMVVWTAVFVLYYLYQVWRNVAIPEIDPSIVALMGLASTTYLAGKYTDRTQPGAGVPPPAPPPAQPD